jgi:uncharacterized membrane protein YhaH (DUF805 family)
MDFGKAISSYFSNYANFKGRARRSEYWFSVLFVFLVALAATVLDTILFGSEIGLFYVVVLLGTFIPTLAVTWRRFHDIGKSGGFYFIGLIPLVGAILLIVWLATDSQPTANQYGPPVK